jgi:hypothetical protein
MVVDSFSPFWRTPHQDSGSPLLGSFTGLESLDAEGVRAIGIGAVRRLITNSMRS